MGLKFIIAEAQNRVTQASQVSGQAQQGITSLQQSIQRFLSAPLSSTAYDSAKSYFLLAYTPLCQSVILTTEALQEAHKKFLSEFQAFSGIDLDEEQLQREIDQYQQLLETIDEMIRDAKTPRPDLERRATNAYEAKQKRQEKLDNFREYNSRSASFFAEYEACQQELNQGLAQVKDSKAWNPATGTFDMNRLDMSWAKPIQMRWQGREDKKERLRMEAFEKGMDGRRYCRVEVAGGASVWLWVKDPQHVTQADLQFNQNYKDYLDLLNQPENNLADEAIQRMVEELKKGINQQTGEPLSQVETIQRWAAVTSALLVVLTGAYYGAKGVSGKVSSNKSVPKGSKNGKKSKIGGANKKARVVKSTLTPEIEAKILEGQRKGTSNGINGGHSPNINNVNPNFATETIKVNPDGTKVIKYTKQFPDGNISKIKTSTVFPDGWSDKNIIDSIHEVSNSNAIGQRSTDGLTLHRGKINGIEIDVIKKGNEIISGYPVGGKPTPGFDPIK